MDYLVRFSVSCGILRGLLRMGVMRHYTFNCELPLNPSFPNNAVDEAKQIITGYLIGARLPPSPGGDYVTARLNEIRKGNGETVPFEEGLEIKVTKDQYRVFRK